MTDREHYPARGWWWLYADRIFALYALAIGVLVVFAVRADWSRPVEAWTGTGAVVAAALLLVPVVRRLFGPSRPLAPGREPEAPGSGPRESKPQR